MPQARRTLCVYLKTDTPGVNEAPPPHDPVITVHIGRSADIEWEREGQIDRGVTVHGDINIIPAGVASRWKVKCPDQAVVVRVPQDLMRRMASEMGLEAESVAVRNRFRIRDPQMEQIVWALKAEMEEGFCTGALYLDGLLSALASRLLHRHSTLGDNRPATAAPSRLPGRVLREALSYIEDNLGEDLTVAQIADVSGFSCSHFNKMFRETVGVPIHQYVIRRRLERARVLLATGRLPISQVASETGFSHQSHLARHMRKVFGVTPRALLLREARMEALGCVSVRAPCAPSPRL